MLFSWWLCSKTVVSLFFIFLTLNVLFFFFFFFSYLFPYQCHLKRFCFYFHFWNVIKYGDRTQIVKWTPITQNHVALSFPKHAGKLGAPFVSFFCLCDGCFVLFKKNFFWAKKLNIFNFRSKVRYTQIFTVYIYIILIAFIFVHLMFSYSENHLSAGRVLTALQKRGYFCSQRDNFQSLKSMWSLFN